VKLSEIMKRINPEITLEIGKFGYDSKISINGKELTNVKSFSVTVSADKLTKLNLEMYGSLKIVKRTFKMTGC